MQPLPVFLFYYLNLQDFQLEFEKNRIFNKNKKIKDIVSGQHLLFDYGMKRTINILIDISK
jgi:hypothetical protein